MLPATADLPRAPAPISPGSSPAVPPVAVTAASPPLESDSPTIAPSATKQEVKLLAPRYLLYLVTITTQSPQIFTSLLRAHTIETLVNELSLSLVIAGIGDRREVLMTRSSITRIVSPLCHILDHRKTTCSFNFVSNCPACTDISFCHCCCDNYVHLCRGWGRRCLCGHSTRQHRGYISSSPIWKYGKFEH